MKNNITTIIRDRGQITIPNKIRKTAKWAHPKAVISITINSSDELVIMPYEKEQKKQVNWGEIWAGICKARSLKGKKGSASSFIIKDRERH